MKRALEKLAKAAFLLVVVTGTVFTSLAGQGRHVVRTNVKVERISHDTSITSVPTPLFDDTPINPDSYNKTPVTVKGTDSAPKPYKRDAGRRR